MGDVAWLALGHGHLQRIQDQLGTHVRIHGPSDDLARVHIQHHRQPHQVGVYVTIH